MEFESLRDLRLHGLAKFFHHIFMFVSYPVRHPFKFVGALLIIAILLFIASFFVPQTSDWSHLKAENILHQVSKNSDTSQEKAVEKTETALKKFAKKFKLKHAESQPVENSENSEVVETETKSYQVWNIPENSLVHEKAEQKQDVVVSEKVEKEPEPDTFDEPKRVPSEAEKFPYQKAENADMVYDDESSIVFGDAIVYGPNELYVSGTYLYLHGIKTDSLKYNVSEATRYLRELINSEKVECHAVDKTEDDILTAVCFKSGININESMVEAGFADDTNL